MKLTKKLTIFLIIPDGLDPEEIWEEFKENFDFDSNGDFYPSDGEAIIQYEVVEES